MIGAGILVAGAVIAVVAYKASDDESGSETPIYLSGDADGEDDDLVYGLGPGRLPIASYHPASEDRAS